MQYKRKWLTKIVTFLTISWSLLSWADSNEHHQHPQAAHVHGLAKLMLALEGKHLDISFESPAMNLVGFEHRASTAAQRQAVKQARDVLSSAQSLFTFSGTSCQLQTAKVNMSVVADKAHAAHESAHHSDISAHYQFQCQQTETLKSLSVELFKHFSGIEQINVMWVSAKEQGASVLRANTKQIQLR